MIQEKLIIKTEKELRRFLSKIEFGTSDECWEWKASDVSKNSPYGSFRLRGKGTRAHRVAYTLFKGPIPEGLTVDHLCFNTRCQNPQHLEACTQSENVKRSADRAGRFFSEERYEEGYYKTREYRLAVKKEWAKANREHINAYQREYHRKWRAAKGEEYKAKHREYQRKWRAKKKQQQQELAQ